MNLALKRQLWALLYFSIASLFTGWFIQSSPYPIDKDQFILSNIVSLVKWSIQIVAALILLRGERWLFIKNIGFVYLLGSCVLLPFAILKSSGMTNDLNLFVGSQLGSVLFMIYHYNQVVSKSRLSINWWLGWLGCQIIAIILQITVVFRAV